MPCVLATSGFIQHHTATNIGQRLVEISSFFGVAGRVQAVIHDEAANQVVALRVATDEYRKQYLGGSWTSIVCAAHSLQTCLKYGFNLTTIAALVSAGRKLVGQFRHSTKFKATHALITAQKPREQAHGQHRVQQQLQQEQRVEEHDTGILEQENVKKPLKLIQDNSTRWNSTFYMLRRLLLLRVPILKVLSDRQVSKCDDVLLDLSVYQWSLPEELVKVLGPFEVATTVSSAAYNVSLPCMLPIMDGLRNSLQGATDDLPEISEF